MVSIWSCPAALLSTPLVCGYVLCPFQSPSRSSNKLTILSFLAHHFLPLLFFLNRGYLMNIYIMIINSVTSNNSAALIPTWLDPYRNLEVIMSLFISFFLSFLLLMTGMIDNCPSLIHSSLPIEYRPRCQSLSI